MQHNNFRYELRTELNAEAIWNIVKDPRKWWTGLYNEQIEGKSDVPGDAFDFRAGDGVHYSRQELVTFDEQRLIEWKVVESALNFLDDPTEWNGTVIRFEIFPEAGENTVVFTHEGLIPEIECYDSCSTAWNGYMKRLENLMS